MTSRVEQERGARTANPRILVVEDERIIALDIRTRLGLLGFEAVGDTDTAEGAIAMAEELRPDLVLMDIYLRGKPDGIFAAAEIQGRLNIPVVYISAYGDDETMNRAKGTHPFGYLLKPIQDKDLRTAIEIGLQRHQAEQALQEARSRLEVQERRQASIITLGFQALSGADLGALFDAAISTVVRDLQAGLASIFELLPDRERLFLRAGWGWPPGLVGSATVEAGPNSLPGYTIQAHEPVASADVPSETRWRPWQIALDLGVRSALSVFMQAGAQPFGALLVATLEPRDFTKADTDYLQAIANVLTTAMERKANETRLQGQAAQLQEQATILGSIQDVVIVTDLDGRMVFWNAGAESLLGYRAEEAVGKTAALLYPDHDDAQFQRDFRDVLAGKGLFEAWRGARKDGAEVFAEVKTQVLRDQEGNPTRVLAVARDITERRRLEQTILGLSVPVTEIREGLLLLPLVGEMDRQRAGLMSERVLRSVRTYRAKVVVIDVTGLLSLDSYVVGYLANTTRAARLLGAQVILTGVSSQMARTLVELGAGLGELLTQGDLRRGIEVAEKILQREGK